MFRPLQGVSFHCAKVHISNSEDLSEIEKGLFDFRVILKACLPENYLLYESNLPVEGIEELETRCYFNESVELRISRSCSLGWIRLTVRPIESTAIDLTKSLQIAGVVRYLACYIFERVNYSYVLEVQNQRIEVGEYLHQAADLMITSYRLG